MGGHNSTLNNTTVNDVTNKVLNNALTSSTTTQKMISGTTVSEYINVGPIVANHCNINIGNVNITTNFNYASKLDVSTEASLQNELVAQLQNVVSQNKTYKSEMGADWGSVSNEETNNMIQNTLKNIIQNTVTVTTINEQLASYNLNIVERIAVKAIQCQYSNIDLDNVNLMLTEQANFVAKSLTTSIIGNKLFQSLVNQVSQTMATTTTGLASLAASILGGLIPLAIIFGVVFIFGGVVLKQGVKSFTDWKLWLVFGLLVSVYFVIAFFTRFWPWRKYYSVELNSQGFRDGSCVRDDKNGIFGSMQDCLNATNDPKNLMYYDRFWGIDSKGKCSRYQKAVNILPDGSTMNAIYADEKECKAQQPVFVPIYKQGLSKADADTMRGAPPSVEDDSAQFCTGPNSNYYAAYDSSTHPTQPCRPTQPGEIPASQPYFTSQQDCINAIAKGAQTMFYIPQCSQQNCSSGPSPTCDNSNSCMYYMTRLTNPNYADLIQLPPDAQQTPFTSADDICSAGS